MRFHGKHQPVQNFSCYFLDFITFFSTKPYEISQKNANDTRVFSITKSNVILGIGGKLNIKL